MGNNNETETLFTLVSVRHVYNLSGVGEIVFNVVFPGLTPLAGIFLFLCRTNWRVITDQEI